MKRALELERTPGLALPLGFLLIAPWFGAAAGLFLAWHGGAALASRWSGLTLALTHLLTLGFLSMTMAGSLLQMLPVVAGLPLRLAAAARAARPLLALGTIALACGFAGGGAPLFSGAAILLGAGFALLLACLLASLCRTLGAGAAAVGAIVRGMRLASGALLLTVTAGLAMAAWLAGGPAVPAAALTDLHAAFGLGGWVALLVIAVSFQVVPMFQGTSPYPAPLARWLPPAFALLLAAWAGARWLDGAADHGGWRSWPAALAAAAVLAWIVASLRLLLRQRRAKPDPTRRHWLLALASLALASLLFAWPGDASNARTLATGVAFVAGFAMSVVDGMLYKIVPFLLWYHMQERAARGTRVPKTGELVTPRQVGLQWACHAAAVAAGLLACAWPPLARPAGVLLGMDCLLLALGLLLPLLRHRRLLRVQPS